MLQMRAESWKDARSFVQHSEKISQLRSELGCADEVLLDPLHFLTSTDDTRRSCSVACWHEDQLVGLMYATEHTVRGVRTGYAIGGDFTGRGLLLCKPEFESDVITASVKQMTLDGIHSLHLRLLPRTSAKPVIRGMKIHCLDGLITGDRLMLAPNFDQFLGTLGKHTRRNVRSYMRKSKEAGITFAGLLTPEDYQAGVERLNANATFRADPLRLERDERLLTFHSGAGRFGLRSADGDLVAVLCGFSHGKRFHLLTQLNDVGLEHLSLSMVLRGYLMQHLIESGHTELQFIGGSSLSFGRFCSPLQYRSVFADKRRGPAAVVKQLCSVVNQLLTGMEKPVPLTLKMICSGHLPESELLGRTTLAPAMLVFPRDTDSETHPKRFEASSTKAAIHFAQAPEIPFRGPSPNVASERQNFYGPSDY
jgi:hypothetical protein